MNRKTTKRALGLSFVSLLLCFTMLMGTTFAWFTDNATVAVNKIEAGTLKIDIQSADGSKSVKDGTLTTIGFADQDDNKLWEPGCRYELEAVKLVNKGNLYAKYKVVITATTGDVDLAEVIDVYENDVKLGTLRDFLDMTDGFKEGVIAPETEQAFGTLKLVMQESAGNEYQGKTIEGIAITVQATQAAVEYDSEDNTYDAGAEYDKIEIFDEWDGSAGTEAEPPAAENDGTILINSAAEFVAFAKDVNGGNTYEGKTVKLNTGIDMDNHTEWEPMTSFVGTFDGQDHTIKNMTENLFGTVSGTVKNLNVTNVNILNTTKNGANGFIGKVATGGVIDNCNVSGVDIKWTAEVNAKDTTDGFGGVIGSVQADATVQNCEFSDITVTSNGKTKRTGAVFSSIVGTVKGCVFNDVNFTVADTDTLEGWVTSHGGGLACDVNGGAVVEDCVINNMQVNVYEAAGHVGGIFGKAHISGQTALITLKNITVNGLTMKVGNASESMKCVAGFIAQPDSRKNDVRVAIDNCHINGLDMTLASSKQGESAAAGFISGLCGGVDITNCSVSGDIDGTNTPANIGGFVGDAGWYGAIEQNFTDCSTNVNITVKDSIAGGFIAVDGTLSNGTAILNFTECEANGTVTVVDGGTGTANKFCGITIE